MSTKEYPERYLVEAPGALPADGGYVVLANATGGSYAVTLAAPTAPGVTLTITMGSTDDDAVTLALTNVVGGSSATSASFDAEHETLQLRAIESKWVVVDEHGVSLS